MKQIDEVQYILNKALTDMWVVRSSNPTAAKYIFMNRVMYDKLVFWLETHLHVEIRATDRAKYLYGMRIVLADIPDNQMVVGI